MIVLNLEYPTDGHYDITRPYEIYKTVIIFNNGNIKIFNNQLFRQRSHNKCLYDLVRQGQYQQEIHPHLMSWTPIKIWTHEKDIDIRPHQDLGFAICDNDDIPITFNKLVDYMYEGYMLEIIKLNDLIATKRALSNKLIKMTPIITEANE